MALNWLYSLVRAENRIQFYRFLGNFQSYTHFSTTGNRVLQICNIVSESSNDYLSCISNLYFNQKSSSGCKTRLKKFGPCARVTSLCDITARVIGSYELQKLAYNTFQTIIFRMRPTRSLNLAGKCFNLQT